MLLLSSVGFFALRCATSPAIPFIHQDPSAPWIMPPVPVSGALHQWGEERVPITSYARLFSFDASQPPTPVSLRIRAFRGFSLGINGEPVEGGLDDGARWREERRIDLRPLLRGGENEIRVDIANARGPALLSLSIDGLDPPVRSDSSWGVWSDGRFLGPALVADDTRRNPATLAVETPLEAMVAQRDVLLAFFTLGLLATFLAPRLIGENGRRRLPSALAFGIVVAWFFVFFAKFLALPSEVGFDARHHLHYVDWLWTNLSVPLATEGWSVYHPPLFYAVAAVFQQAGEAIAGDPGANFGIKLVPFLSGLANVWIAALLGRRLFPDDRRVTALAVLFAAVLPMNLYASAYFSNETFHTALAGLALLVSIDLMLEPSNRRRLLSLGLLIALGLLTKYTAVIVGAVAAFFVLTKFVSVEKATPAEVAARFALVAVPPALLAGWFYVRNIVLFGDPLIANWGDMPGPTLKWWQQPGFHTASFYSSFGESLVHPYLSAFRSFWDSLYSTLWGDGGIAGRVNPAQRHSFWNYEFMSATYLVAIPATIFAAAGALRCVGRAFTDTDVRRRAAFSFLLTLTYAIAFGLIYMSLRLPYFAQAKASYGLVVMAPLALFFADGMLWLDDFLQARGLRIARAAIFGWFVSFVAACYLSFAG